MNNIEFGEHNIDYNLKRSKRKSLGMTVNAKGQLIVTAPDYIPLDKIEEVLRKRKNWIIGKIEEKTSNLQVQPKRRFVSGEAIHLFGRQYTLKVTEANYLGIERKEDSLIFHMEDTSKAEKVISSWLVTKLKDHLDIKTIECLDKFTKCYPLDVVPTFKIRKMSKRWGSCTSEGSISFNPKLVAASIECIEYVVFHELSHLLYDDHSEDFFRVLKSVCPNYKTVKERLDKETVLFED
jgi:predicted metal-dependent hydrolase